MRLIRKAAIAVVSAGAITAATATAVWAQTGGQAAVPETFGFANVNTPGPNGQCWNMTNKEMGFGYWGACPEGAASQTPGRRAQRQASSARASVESGTGVAATNRPAAPTYPFGATEAPNTPGPLSASSAFGASGPANDPFPFAYVNSPGPNGQCWQMNNKEMGFGYRAPCPQGAAAPAATPRASRQARRQ